MGRGPRHKEGRREKTDRQADGRTEEKDRTDQRKEGKQRETRTVMIAMLGWEIKKKKKRVNKWA